MSNQGRFTWYELMSTDPAAGLDFYAGLTGWTHQLYPASPPEGVEMPPYHVWMKGEEPMAGCMELPAEAQEQGAPTHWMGYMHTDDVEATKARAIELGATELTSMEMPEVGKFAVMLDPSQAAICFFQSANEPGPEQAPAPGRFSWHELYTDDYQKAFDFYSELFGWEVIDDMDMGEPGVYRLFGRNGQQMGGMMNRPEQMPVNCWMYYISVPNVDEAAEAIKAAGGTVTVEPMEVPGGDRILMGIDPQGGAFALHSVGQASAEA
jgi:predicted enzyme related to lactoylglutathione lyase